MNTASAHRHYNPDWLSDDDLLAGFVARVDEFTFLRDELARASREGSVQHYLLVGLRGAGKTTLLKRLAVAIRRDADLEDHLIALSFPEELYQVKNLADFWWAACDALADELDRMGQTELADRLIADVDRARSSGAGADPLADTGFKLLLQICTELGRRPVLLVDNLDFIFQRIDKTGRKLKDPHAPAYWALREILSTTTAPIVIGGSVRLSEPFTDYDKAFYDFFIPKRLGKLDLMEVRQVLERLADAQDVPEVKDRLRARPGRVDALYQLTGGNPRALGLIFELLRHGPNSRAVEDFERLMDITTPYYKARFEDLSEQAQVVMHALAVRRPGDGGGLRFGHTAAEIGAHAGLPTGTVSAQMDVLDREGLVEKSAAHGRTQYRIAEQLFRLWLQMRGNRRIRQNVIGLTEFLEAMFDLDELQDGMQIECGAGALAAAQFSFALAGARCATQMRRGLEVHGADRLLQHVWDRGGAVEDFLPAGDLSEDLAAVVRMRDQLQRCKGGLTVDEQDALLGSVELRLDQKQASVQALCERTTAQEEAARVRLRLDAERRRLQIHGLHEADLVLLFSKRACGYLPLPCLLPQDAEDLLAVAGAPGLRAMVWRLVGARDWVKFANDEAAKDWLDWGLKYASDASATEWANVAGAMRRSRRFAQAQQALDQAVARGVSSRTWYERAALLGDTKGDLVEAEAAFRKAIDLDPSDAWLWNGLGVQLTDELNRHDDAEAAFRKAIELAPTFAWPWGNLANLLTKSPNRHDEAEAACRKAIKLDPEFAGSWNDLGNLLAYPLNRFDEAEAAYRKAIEFDPAFVWSWNDLGNLLAYPLNRFDEAEAAYRKAIGLAPTEALPWNNLGRLLEARERLDEAFAAYSRAAELDANQHPFWRERYAKLQTRRYAIEAKQAHELGHRSALRDALARLLADSADIAAALVSAHFVEGFLAPVLASGQGAAALLDLLRDLGYEKHARPLLLAFEAAMENCPDKLVDIEPEVQAAAQLMLERLTAPKKPKLVAKRATRRRKPALKDE
ncbi:MAG: tetratricopeptide repeat protein [Sulfuritalea sp.]|jgi:tetratricopeptide (TPR) repeat protein|nr:tetratricopeptide repeat protein [Sulfuritalea sp.]